MTEKSFWDKSRGERGQGTTEYIIIISLVAVACLLAVGVFGSNVRNLLVKSSDSLELGEAQNALFATLEQQEIRSHDLRGAGSSGGNGSGKAGQGSGNSAPLGLGSSSQGPADSEGDSKPETGGQGEEGEQEEEEQKQNEGEEGEQEEEEQKQEDGWEQVEEGDEWEEEDGWEQVEEGDDDMGYTNKDGWRVVSFGKTVFRRGYRLVNGVITYVRFIRSS